MTSRTISPTIRSLISQRNTREVPAVSARRVRAAGNDGRGAMQSYGLLGEGLSVYFRVTDPSDYALPGLNQVARDVVRADRGDCDTAEELRQWVGQAMAPAIAAFMEEELQTAIEGAEGGFDFSLAEQPARPRTPGSTPPASAGWLKKRPWTLSETCVISLTRKETAMPGLSLPPAAVFTSGPPPRAPDLGVGSGPHAHLQCAGRGPSLLITSSQKYRLFPISYGAAGRRPTSFAPPIPLRPQT